MTDGLVGPVGTMRNTKTKRVFDYWLALKGTRPVPFRRDVSPRDLKGLLPFVFLAERVDAQMTVFRLAGTGLCERYGRELRDHNLEALWSAGDRPAFRRFVERILTTPAPGLASFRAETVDCRSVCGEMLLLPLANSSRADPGRAERGDSPDQDAPLTRLLGCAFATQSTSWLGQRPLVHHYLEGTRMIEQPGLCLETTAPLKQATAGGPAEAGAQTAPMRQRGHLKLVVSHDTPPALARQASPHRFIG
ncbi:MAG: PAS domain-containing protein [Alphaproteobacteria bacterium]